MSRIAAIDPAHAEGKSKQLLDGVQKGVGMVPNLYRVVAQSPSALEGLLGLTGALSHGKLDAQLREQVAIAIANRNGCDYCLSAHTLLGGKAGVTAGDLELARDAHAGDAKHQAALAFAVKVADHRGQVADADIAAVRAAGFNDGEIVELIAHVALNFFTNMANNVALTDIDFPKVSAATRRAA